MLKIKMLKPVAAKPSAKALYGEIPLPFAPQVCLRNGKSATPQQYLKVQRSVSNIEEILERIEFSDDYLLFTSQENGVLSIQVGVIGCENYPKSTQQEKEKKIVYGRRWLIEPSAPTSEVIQTAMLAIKKAREHELREHVLFYVADKVKTTPFNNHMDLPLMSKDIDFFEPEFRNDESENSIRESIERLLEATRLSSSKIRLDQLIMLGERRCLVDLKIESIEPNIHFPELNQRRVSVLCDNFSRSQFLHELINQLIKCSDLYVEENFIFDGFARFSQNVCPEKIAEFSYLTRKIRHKDLRFHKYFREMSYDVDASKTPSYGQGLLGEHQRNTINKKNVAAGHLPNEHYDNGIVRDNIIKSESA